MPFFSQSAGSFPNIDAMEEQLQQSQNPPATQQAGNANTQHYDQFSEAETLSEVEVRLVKANYYRAILEQPLFGADDSDIAYEVEQEFRAFALERLRILLGMQAEKQPEEKPFTPDQEEVLREWADRLIVKPQLLGVAANPAPQVQQATVRQPAPVAPAPAPKPVQPTVNQVAVPTQQAPKRRGRPPGTGKNQRAAQAPQAPLPQLTQAEIDNGVKVDAGGKYMEQPGHDAITGQPKLIKVYLQAQQTPVNDPNYKPMPMADSDTLLMKEQMEATSMHNKAINLHPAMGQILNHFISKE
jgi:hypothetical protein